MSSAAAGKVIKNTMALYLRMIVLTIISLFTYRVILQALGASDYGTYNVVGGFIAMFSFVSGTMINASQRFLAINMVDNDWDKINKMFSINLFIYIALSILILLVAETLGLWFVMNKLNVDYSRSLAIFIVYQTSVLTFLMTLLISPFMALMVADENLTVYSWVSILEGILRVVVAYLLCTIKGDKLIVYSILSLVVAILINGFYLGYCTRKYKKLKITFCKDIGEYKAVFKFINWNLIGAIAAVGKNQGMNIIINIFFGTVVNAARGIAAQLNSVISSFAQNFMKAIDPRIMKAYASGDETTFASMLKTSSKVSYYLLLVVSLPFILNVEYVLGIWLVEVPQYTAIFTILALVDALILSMTDPLLTAVQAIGDVKVYQMTVGTLSLLNLPVAYILLQIYDNPIVPFVVAIVIDSLITFGRMLNVKRLYPFSIWEYCKVVVFPIMIVTGVTSVAAIQVFFDAGTFVELVINVLGTIACLAVMVYSVGLDANERLAVKKMIPLKRR